VNVRLRDLIRLTSSALLAHRLRAVLTMLGVLIGIASVILLTSIGEGTRRYIVGQFTQFGTNLVAINPGKTFTSGAPGALGGTTRKLTIEDAEALLRVRGVERMVPLSFGFARVEANERGRSVYVYGVTSDVPEVWKFRVRQGRFLPPSDPHRGAPLCVIGPKLKRELFGEANALGQHVRIGGSRFLVVGIMEPKGQFLNVDLDDSAYIPVARAQALFNRDGLWEIDVLFSNQAVEREVVAGIKEVLTARHDGKEDFTVTTQAAMLDVLGSIMDIINVAVGGIAGISLVVGALGILTMMWISVNERTAEIGVAKAVGATATQVMLLFLAEATLLSVLGGALGVATGMGLARVIQLALPGLPVFTPVEFVVAAIAVSLAVGLLSGVLPARRAARLDPVEALRAE
jgi:putative ABC transport system permease protein